MRRGQGMAAVGNAVPPAVSGLFTGICHPMEILVKVFAT